MDFQKNKGKLIVFEGNDGSGKYTQQKLLIKYFEQKQIKFSSFDFPQYGKTFFGDFAGRFLNGEFGHFSQINPYLASFPYAADRWQVRDQLWDAINEGKIVICNRYTPSAIYQAVKVNSDQRAAFIKWVEKLEYEVFNIPKPDLILFLYIPISFAQLLISKKNKRPYLDGKAKDQYEEDVDYLQKVELQYLEMVKNNQNWIKIDCVDGKTILSPEVIHIKIVDTLKKLSLHPNL